MTTGPFFTVTDYAATPAGFGFDGVATNSSTTFTSAAANFNSGDVGKPIVIFRAGSSTNRPQVTSISAVTDAHTITLGNAANRSQSSCFFLYGADQTTGIQAAITAAKNAGGGTVFLPGFYFVSQVTMANNVILASSGMLSGGLLQTLTQNKPLVTSDTTANANSQFYGVRDMLLFGSRLRQAAISTSLSSDYTAGSGSAVLTSVTNILPSGKIKAVNGANTNILYYSSISGNTLTIISGGRENTTDISITAAGSTVTHEPAIGFYHASNPYSTQGTNDLDFDANYFMSNVMVMETRGVGVSTWGRSAAKFTNVKAYFCGEGGFRPSYDSWLVNCDSGWAGRMGFCLSGNQQHLVNCTSWFSGTSSTTAADVTDACGFYASPEASNPDEGSLNLTGCTAQDNAAEGFTFVNSDRVTMSGATVSSNWRWQNNASFGVSGAAVRATALTYSNLDFVATERGNFTFATITAATNANPIVLTATAHGMTTGQTITVSVTGVLGNTAANGVWDAVITDANTITLTGVAGNGVWSSGGTQKVGPAGQVNALSIDVNSVNNKIRMTHQASKVTQAQVRVAIKSGSVLTGAGNVIDVNGQNNESWPPLHPGFMDTIGLPGVAATAVTTAISNTSYFQYVGRAQQGMTTVDLVCRVTTAAVAAITWAEVGIFKGTPVSNGAATLTRMGFADVSATFNSTGIKKTTITLTTNIQVGDDIWIAYGSQAATAFQLRGSQVDDIQSGVLQEKATTRISTVAAATAMGISAASLVGAWIVAKV